MSVHFVHQQRDIPSLKFNLFILRVSSTTFPLFSSQIQYCSLNLSALRVLVRFQIPNPSPFGLACSHPVDHRQKEAGNYYCCDLSLKTHD